VTQAEAARRLSWGPAVPHGREEGLGPALRLAAEKHPVVVGFNPVAFAREVGDVPRAIPPAPGHRRCGRARDRAA
jgi:hypothetical protein